MAAPELSCVIVAFHDAPSLDDLLGRLHAPAVQVLVVNVEGDAAVTDVVRAHDATNVTLSGNPGYAAAVNTGAALATAPVTVFMNDDVIVDLATLHALVRPIGSATADVTVPAVVTASGAFEPTIAALATPSTLMTEWLLLPDRPIGWLQRRLTVQKWRKPTGVEPVLAASALLVAVRTDLLQQVPLPEEYFLYWEESEWFWRLRERGAVVEYHPELSVVHAGGRDDVRPAKSRLMARNAVRCVRRTQGSAAAARAVPVVIAWNLRLFLTAGLRAVIRPSGNRAVLRSRLAGLGAAFGSLAEVWGGRA